jgi:hypothetical protein
MGNRRVFILGSEAVLADDPEVKAASAGLKSETPVEWDTPPRLLECGPQLMDVFTHNVSDAFRAAVRDNRCSAVAAEALCMSEYLPPPYESSVLRIDYKCAAGKCRLELSCAQFHANADASDCGWSTDDKRKYNDLWEELRAVSKSCVR